MKKYNFNPGPGTLPQVAIEAAAKAILDFNGSGLSLLEVSHRGKDVIAFTEEAVKNIKELLNVPAGYSVVFLQGGASMQFAMAPMNLLDDDRMAAYTDTGVWANKAIKEAKLFGTVNVLASSKDKTYNFIPKTYDIPKDAVYFHVTSNNTIYGTQLHSFPDSPVPLVSDMSSDIFSRPLDVSKFDLIYAGAQKNAGPAGVTIAIVKDAALGKVKRKIPAMLDYKIHIENESMYNTPPVFSIFVMNETLKWVKAQGGLAAMEKINQDKAKVLYDEMDRSSLFLGTCAKEDRSLMNVCFIMRKPELEAAFEEETKKAGLVNLKGHRSVGGFRASIYNAMPKAGVERLVEVMQDFAKKNG